MEQTSGYDPTLPLDFDGSSNMNGLEEVTFGDDPSGHDHSASTSRTMPQGHGLLFPNLLAKSNSGRMSPVRGRTMKEYDQQITELKKENFSLKLRIYYLEERMQQKYGDGEDIFKTNVELNVSVQSLKKELEDKQELLRKASQAIESLTSSQQSDIDIVKKSLEEHHHKYTNELRSDLQKALQDAEDAREELESGRERWSEVEVRLHQMEIDQQQSAITAQKLKDAIDMKERDISALQLESDSLARDLEDTRRQLHEAARQRDAAQHRTQQLEKDVQRGGRDIKDVVDDQRDNLGHMETRIAELEDSLTNKDHMIGKLEEGLKEKEKALKDATNQMQQMSKELEEHEILGNRRDKTVGGLVAALNKKEREVTSTKVRLSKSEGALKKMKAELHEAEVAKRKVRQLRDQLGESENSNQRLQTQLRDANVEGENMIKSLGKKEGELTGFREQLQQANQALKRSEEALEGLQEQLEKERSQAHDDLDKQARDYQHMVDDYFHQLEGKDSLMAHMTAQLRSKDQHLSSLMNLLTNDAKQGQQVLLQKLEDDLNRSSGSVQRALEERQAEVERKGRELWEARQALHSKGRELEQASLQLLKKQEKLENLQLHSRQQGETTVQLSHTLAKSQQTLEESLDRHAQVLQEKDAVVEHLQKALAEKERMVEELTNQSPSVDNQERQLRAQLREKDQLIQELQTDCVRASCEKEQALRSSQASLLEKDRQIQALDQKQQKELLNRDQEIQQLTCQLSKKDLQLGALESRFNDAEASHREALHRMHRRLAEKDRTIEAMMDSVGEKERLLRRSQQNLTEDAKAQMADMDTILAENSHLKRLLREKEEALQEEIRQGSRHDNRETHHSSYHETVTHTNTADNAQMHRLLEEQIRETKALSELLRHDKQQQLLVNLTTQHTNSHSHSREEGGSGGGAGSEATALQAELSAVSALRQRLQEGLDKHHQLHRSLLGHTSRPADHLLSESDEAPSLGSSSCNDRPPEQSHHGDAASTSGKDSGGGGGGGEKTSSLAVQASPFDCGGALSREGTSGDRPHADPQGSHTGAGEGKGVPPEYLLGRSISEEEGLAREASQDSVLSSINSLSSAELAGMSAGVLRDLVSQLQEDLVAAGQRNAALQRELQELQAGDRHHHHPGLGPLTQSRGGVVGAHSSTADDLHQQVESLRKALQLKDEETAQLRQHLGLPSEPGSDLPPALDLALPDLHSQVHKLRHQVKDMDKVNKALKQQLALNRASEEEVDPQRLVSMAVEIDRLREENCRLSARIKHSSQRQGEGLRKDSGMGMQEVSLGGDVSEGGMTTMTTEQRDVSSELSLLSPTESSPALHTESFSQDLSRNTNRHTDSAHSQDVVSNQWSSMAQSVSQSSQSDSEWAPRVMHGEGGVGGKCPPLARMKLSGKDCVLGEGGPPLRNVSGRSQERVQSLEERLAATEGTVRYMSQRLRHYRWLLHAAVKGNGDVPMGLPRSQSQTHLWGPLPSRLSSSLSCSDLREASSGGLGPDRSPDMPASPAAQQRGMGGWDVPKAQTPSGSPHAIMNTLNQHIKALKGRSSQGVDAGKPADGVLNLSGLSSYFSTSRGTMRGGDLTDGKSLSRLAGPNTTVLSEMSGSGSEPSTRQERCVTTASHGRLSPSPPEMMMMPLGENALDRTAIDNLTYFSFSESILPLDQSEGQREDALSVGQGSCQQGVAGSHDARRLVDQGAQSSENTEGTGSSGDETMCIGNGTLLSDLSGNEGGASEEESSSRLKNRVQVLTDMNRTLREELGVYDSLCQSLGVQVSVAEGGESGGKESGDSQVRLLQLHLAELKKLRTRLEQLDTDAHNAVHMTSQLNSQHITRIAELESLVSLLRTKLTQQTALADDRATTLLQQEKELQLLHDNLAALQDCETQRTQQHEAEVAELQQQVEESQQQSRELQEEVEERRKQQKSCDVKLSQSQQHLSDLENRLSKAMHRGKFLEGELRKAQLSSQDLQSQLSAAETRTSTLDDEARSLRQSGKKLETELKESTQRVAVLETRLSQAERGRSQAEKGWSEAERALKGVEEEGLRCRERMEALEREVKEIGQQKEDLLGRLRLDEDKSRQLMTELSQVREEWQRLETEVTHSVSLKEECQQQQQRAQHYQERMAHYEQCMREYQHRVHECESQVDQLKNSLQSSLSREQEADSGRHQALSRVQQLQAQLREAEGRASTKESMAHRADTLARSLEARLREMECKVKEMEERTKELEYELQTSQTTASEQSRTLDGLKKEISERSTKLTKRDRQLTRLVPEYKKVYACMKETAQLNHTLKVEVKLYESMMSQTVSCNQEELIKQLLHELSQTRRLAEDVISRLEHSRRNNDSPASTAGPEAADGRPSPEPRDSLQRMLSESTVLRVHTDSHSSAGHSQASSLSDHSYPQQAADSPGVCTPLSSPGGSTFSGSGARPKTLLGTTTTTSQEGEASGNESSSGGQGHPVPLPDWVTEGEAQTGDLRSHSHPASLKYWRDQPLAALSGPSGVPRVEVDSDIRRLFAISSLDGYEKLKHENGEILSTLSSMQALLAERLKAFTGVSISESLEYSTLRELQMSARGLRICAEEEGQLLSCFWLTQLPPLNARGEFYDPKLAEEKENLKVELRKQKSRYDLLVHTVREQQERLHATNALRKKWETTLYKQLNHTSGILERSKENFDEAGLSPPKSKSPRKPGHPIKDKN